MYTIQQVLKMYDSKNHETYKNKIKEYLDTYTEMFKSSRDMKAVEVITEDFNVMDSALISLDEGNTAEALDLITGLDTFVREYFLGIIIDIKKAA